MVKYTSSPAAAKNVSLPKALTVKRRFTTKGKDPLEGITYELRTSRITNPDGSAVFEMKDVEVPASWSQVATDILAQKYFRKKGVPDAKGGRNGSEWSAKQVVRRLAGTWRHWGEQHSYFATKEDAQAFEDETAYMLITQMAAPNSPQWFNTGLNFAYGITSDAQGHYYVDPKSGEMKKGEDAYTHPQPHACGRWDTKIMTDEGLLNLGSIVDSDRVDLKIFDGEQWVKILATKENGVKSLYRMMLKNGQYIDFTDDHLIWAADKRIKDGGVYQWTSLKDCLGKRVQLIKQPVKAKVAARYEVPVAEAALAGFHIGDGYAGTYKGISHFGVCINDKDEFNHLGSLFNEVFGTYTFTAKPEISENYRIVRHDFNYAQLFAERFGLGIGSDSVRIHDVIFAAAPEVKAAFLRGLFQADGCVRLRKRGETSSGDVCLTTISEGLAHDVQTLLLSLGIYSRVTTCADSRTDRSLQYHVEVAYESERKKFEECIGFISQAKIKKLRELNETVKGKEKPEASEEEVVSITYVGDEIVYDIQTESGKFLANGVVVHNCFIQSVKDDLVNEGGIFDLMTREARLFKYGSGTGSNFSAIRGKEESLSGGGRSSGLMSFLATIDRAAGAIKSGGTTRRAAKMVCLDIDHPEVEDFIKWKVVEEQKVAALHAGSYICYEQLSAILKSADAQGIDPAKNPELKKLIKKAHEAHVPLNYIKRILMQVEQGMKPSDFDFRRYDTDFRSEAYLTVSGQNSNNSVRITNDFLKAVEEGRDWNLVNRIDKKVAKKLPAKKLWDSITYSAWACADPGLQYDTTINEWHTCPEDGDINASNPCSEYMFLDDTACNLASINLIKFYDPQTRKMDTEAFKYASRLWTVVLEISVLMAQFPSKEIAQKSYEFRTLGLGYANLGTVLMQMGIPYSSEEAYAICGAVTAVMCGESYATSAEMAAGLGAFTKYEKNKKHMLRVMRNHRRAAYNTPKNEYEELSVAPQGIQEKFCPEYLRVSALECWDRALALGEKHGYRNAQVTVIAPTGTIGLIMDCDTTGIEPDFALVKFKKLVGGGYFKIVNRSMEAALDALGYSEDEVQEIEKYLKGHGTLEGCPHINEKSLRALGFTEKEILAIETQLPSVFELRFAFNRFVLGDEFCKNVLGLTDEMLADPKLDMLALLGFTSEQIEAANEYVCGTMTIEGAPHLKEIHYPIFDCANRCGKKGVRFIPWEAHLRMMAAAQAFISGAISKTINMPEESTIEDVTRAYFLSFEYMLKAVALYRDGSKLSQPLNTASGDRTYASLFSFSEGESDESITAQEAQKALAESAARPIRRKLAAERHSITHKFVVANHEGYLTIGLYEDGSPGEIFIKMSKEGSTLSGIMDAFALTISLCLQYGVPLEVLVGKFCHSRFEPSGMTGNRNIPIVKSVVDYIGRYLALKFLPKETAKKYHNEELIERAYAEGNPQHLRQVPKETQAEVPPASGVAAAASASREHRVIEVPKPSAVIKTKEQLAKVQMGSALALNNEDAPMCGTCGIVMVRNGACYKCLECGETSGCS